jgi:deoxyribodipyrimidine photolyase
MRLHESLRELGAGLKALGADLVLLSGAEQDTIEAFASAVDAAEVCWNRRYSVALRHTDASIKFCDFNPLHRTGQPG